MSPLILALFSARGVERTWKLKYGGMGFSAHRCAPRCRRDGCWWMRYWNRPC